MAVVLLTHMALIIIRYIECFLTLGFAGLLFEFSFVKDIKSDLKQFNKIAKNKKSKSPIIEEQLVKLINFDVDLRQLSLSNHTKTSSIVKLLCLFQIAGAYCRSVFNYIGGSLHRMYVYNMSIVTDDSSGIDSGIY